MAGARTSGQGAAPYRSWANPSPASVPGVATEPGPIHSRSPPPYAVSTSVRPVPNRSAGSPRPGISTLPSMVTGGLPSAGSMVTNAPPARLTTPGSVTVATSVAARAASTALPPAAAEVEPGPDREVARRRHCDPGWPPMGARRHARKSAASAAGVTLGRGPRVSLAGVARFRLGVVDRGKPGPSV